MKILQSTAVMLSLLAAMPTVIGQSIIIQPVAAQPQPPRTVSYQCDGGRTFSVDYAQETAQLRLDSVNVIPLPRVVSGSGIRYSNGSTTLYSQSNRAVIEEGGRQTYTNCLSQTTTSTESITSRVFVYQCADNASFEARYQPQSVELMLAGSPSLTLSQVPSGSGARYSDGETTLYTKGSEAFLERNGTRIYDNCLAQTPATQQTTPQAPSAPSPQPAPQMPPRAAEPESVRGMW